MSDTPDAPQGGPNEPTADETPAGAPEQTEPATAPAASAAAAPSAAEPHDTDPDMAAPPSGPVSARGHVNRPADESVPETPAVPVPVAAASAPAAPAPTIEPEPVAASDADVAAAVARTHAEPGATAAGDATVDTASPAQAAAPVIIAGEAAQQQAQQAAAQAAAAQAPAAATAAYASQPGEATWAPEPAAAPPIAPQPVAPIFLQRPEPPKRKSNRGFGILIALVGTALFAVLWAAAVVGVGALLAPGSEFIPALIQFSTHSTAWAPVVAFFIGMVVLIQIVNRARWWAYILGGLFVAVFVYLVYIGAALVDNGFLQKNPGERQILLNQVWVAPFAVLAASSRRGMRRRRPTTNSRSPTRRTRRPTPTRSRGTDRLPAGSANRGALSADA